MTVGLQWDYNGITMRIQWDYNNTVVGVHHGAIREVALYPSIEGVTS